MDFQLEAWHWIALGLILVLGEMVIPTSFLLWFGLAGVITGLVLAVVEVGPAYQLVLFAALAFASYFPVRWAARRWRPGDPKAADTLNRRGRSLIGQHVTVIEAIEDGYGAVKVGDSRWRASSDQDLPVGAKAEVVDVEVTTLKVKPVPSE